jgi:plastocyanin
MRRCVLLASLLVVVAGCGSSSDEGEDEDGAPAAPPVRTITITETEYKLDPSSVDLDKPGTYAFEVVNDGGVAHALEVEGEGLEEETDTIDPGGRATLTVTLEGGSYELYCPIGDHKDRGMEGKAVVAGGSGQATTSTTTTTTEEDSDDGYGY